MHRIGRAGRVGNEGKAISFFDPVVNREMADDLIDILREASFHNLFTILNSTL